MKRIKRPLSCNADDATSTTGQTSINISVLITALYYLKQNVFILAYENIYRLVVYHQKEKQTDAFYKSAEEARNAFSKEYQMDETTRKILHDNGHQPMQWGPFTPLAPRWLTTFKGLDIDTGDTHERFI
ncbi:MAG: hypothetical protein GY765_16275 [bacterium]|nr:hypothetical protein [bacterium]